MLRRAFLKACAAVAVCLTSLVPDLAPREPGPAETIRITSAIDLQTGWVTDFYIDRDGVPQILRMWHNPCSPSVLALDRRVLVIPKRKPKPHAALNLGYQADDSWPAPT